MSRIYGGNRDIQPGAGVKRNVSAPGEMPNGVSSALHLVSA